MIMIVRFFIIALAWALLWGGTAHAEGTDNSVLLSAGNLVVTRQDLQQALLIMSDAERSQTLTGPDPLKALLRQLYQAKQIAIEAERLGLDQTPLVQAQLTASRRLVLSEALRVHTQEQIETPDFAALAREHYAAHRDEFQLPDQYKAAHILKKVHCDCEKEPQRRKTEQILAQLQTGADFAALAKAESDDTGSAAKGGDLGRWLKLQELAPPFADALAKLQNGQISSVVETKYGFHIIKKLDEQPARSQNFDEVQDSIEQHLKQTYVQDQLVQRLADYLPPADAKFDESTIESLLPKR